MATKLIRLQKLNATFIVQVSSMNCNFEKQQIRTNMKTPFILLLALLSIGMCSCNKTGDDNLPEDEKVIQLDEKSAQLVQADNTFGLELFQIIREESNEENILVSPLSISMALAMAYNGADGDTKTEMEQAMKLNKLTPEQINGSYKMLIEALQSLDEDVVFEIANAIFHEESFSVKQNFLDINKNYYNAEVDGLDFSNPSALETINNWVANKTHNKIEKILDELSPDARMVLLNAIYFYGTWAVEFNEDGTKMRNFSLSDGSHKEVEMMSKEDALEYTTNSLFSAVKIPYGTGQYNMVVMLPAIEESSQSVINELSASNWESWNNDFEPTENVVVTMPRFKFESDMKLIPMLKQLGMLQAFSPNQANFSKISEIDLYIGDVIHKTYIDVNETGTEAAAVTAIVIEVTSAGPGAEVEKIYFTVDRPFIFAITEKDTDAILFIGEVKNPEYKE